MPVKGQFEALARLSPVGIFQTNAEGHCIYVNERWCEIAGLSLPEALGEGWIRGLHPADGDRIVKEWYEAVERQGPFAAEYRFQHRDGVTTWVYGQGRPEKRSDGAVLSYVGAITNITERKQLEIKLQETNQTLQALIDASPLALITLDQNLRSHSHPLQCR
jgi:PAS domain S-box-containing protein